MRSATSTSFEPSSRAVVALSRSRKAFRLRSKRGNGVSGGSEEETSAGNQYGWENSAAQAPPANGTAKGAKSTPLYSSMDETWRNQGFAFYQNPLDGEGRAGASSVGEAPCPEECGGATVDDSWDWGHVDKDSVDYNPVWTCIRTEAEEESRAEPLLSSYMYSSVLSHRSFEKALANVLANCIGDATLLATQLYPTFLSVLQKDHVKKAALLDIQVTKDRDPACTSYLEALLNFKGYHALQLHRIAHELHTNGRNVMAQMLQSRASEVFGVDIHPGAKFGKGILIDHATGVVVGETAVVGDNSSLLQGVTLGGTGKAEGDRHPKLGKNVLIGAQATILGNISIGDGSMVAAGSVVLNDVPERKLIAGIPARIVGSTTGMPSTLMDQVLNGLYADQGGIEYFI